MYHKHFNTIGSTQIYLKDHLEELQKQSGEENLLISCSEQTEGIGRRGNSWDSYPNSLAMSFTFKPHATATLTPLEIGLITVQFFKKKMNIDLFLKWPNDILTSDGKKCGGILCQYIDSNTVVVGLGINLGKIEDIEKNDYRHGLSSVDQTLVLTNFDQEKISAELYQSLLSNRLSTAEKLIDTFNQYCFHIDTDVFIFEDGKDYVGIFKGIGTNGEALVEIDSTVQSFMSSSLTILN